MFSHFLTQLKNLRNTPRSSWDVKRYHNDARKKGFSLIFIFINFYYIDRFSDDTRTEMVMYLACNNKSTFRALSKICNNPIGIYMFRVNNRNTRIRCEIRSKLTIKTLERRNMFIVNNKNTRMTPLVSFWCLYF